MVIRFTLVPRLWPSAYQEALAFVKLDSWIVAVVIWGRLSDLCVVMYKRGLGVKKVALM